MELFRFSFLLLGSHYRAFFIVRVLFAHSCMILQSAKNLYESILGVSTNSLAQIQVRTLRTLDC